MTNLSDILAAAKSLNAAADRATKYLESVDAELQSAGVGIEVYGQVIREVAKGAREERRYLGYAKTASGWGLVVQDCMYSRDPDDVEQWDLVEEGSPIPLRNWNRETRLLAVQHIGSLLEQIAREIRDTTERINNAIAKKG